MAGENYNLDDFAPKRQDRASWFSREDFAGQKTIRAKVTEVKLDKTGSTPKLEIFFDYVGMKRALTVYAKDIPSLKKYCPTGTTNDLIGQELTISGVDREDGKFIRRVI